MVITRLSPQHNDAKLTGAPWHRRPAILLALLAMCPLLVACGGSSSGSGAPFVSISTLTMKASSPAPAVFAAQFDDTYPGKISLVRMDLLAPPGGIGGKVPPLVAPHVEPPWIQLGLGVVQSVESVDPALAAAFGSHLFLPLQGYPAHDGDIVDVVALLSVDRAGVYEIAGVRITFRTDQGNSSSSASLGPRACIGSALRRSKSFVAGVTAATKANASSSGAADTSVNPGSPRPLTLASTAVHPNCGGLKMALCAGLTKEYAGLLKALSTAVRSNSSAIPTSVASRLDALGSNSFRALLYAYGSKWAKWPGLPAASTLRPHFYSYPRASAIELADCPWPNPLLPGARYPVAMRLAFFEPKIPGKPMADD